MPEVGDRVVWNTGADEIEWDYSGGFAPLPHGVTIKLQATPASSENQA